MEDGTNEIQKKNDLINTDSLPGTLKNANVTTSAKTLAALGVNILGEKFRGVRITVESGSIRTTDDGTAPTASVGEFRPAGIYFYSRAESRDLQLISNTGANVPCSFQPQTFTP